MEVETGGAERSGYPLEVPALEDYRQRKQHIQEMALDNSLALDVKDLERG
jgi:hypothetical protein